MDAPTHPTSPHRWIQAKSGLQAVPALDIETSGSGQQQLADPIERVAGAAPVSQGLVLGALTATGERLVRQTHDVERIDSDARPPAVAGSVAKCHQPPFLAAGPEGGRLDDRRQQRKRSRHAR